MASRPLATELANLTAARDQAATALELERKRSATEIETTRSQSAALTAARDQAVSVLQTERERAAVAIKAARAELATAHDRPRSGGLGAAGRA